MTNKLIEELRRAIPKRNIFKEDTSIIASDYYNWKDVYEALDKAFEIGRTQAISEFKDIVDSVCYCSLANNPKHNAMKCCLCLMKDRFRLRLHEMLNETQVEQKA